MTRTPLGSVLETIRVIFCPWPENLNNNELNKNNGLIILLSEDISRSGHSGCGMASTHCSYSGL